MLFFVKENEMNIIASTKLTMTSREIADLMAKEHKHVMRDIEVLKTQLGEDFVGSVQNWTHPQNGQNYPEYVLDKSTTLCLVSGYNAALRMRIIKRWDELEGQVARPQQPILPSTQAKVFIRDALEVSALFDVPVHIAQVEAVKGAKRNYGVDYTPCLLNAPAQNNIKAEDEMLEPTEFGKQLGMSAIKFNLMLADFGLQERVDGAWVPTEWAKGLYSRHQWVKGSKSGYNYKWKVSAITKMFEQTEEPEEQ